MGKDQVSNTELRFLFFFPFVGLISADFFFWLFLGSFRVFYVTRLD